MLSSTATRGRNVSTVSSWKLDASTTQIPSAPAAGAPTAAASGSPRLPPTNVGRPVSARIAPQSVVVVDLPLVPVIATSVARSTKRDASSISPVTGTPAARAARSGAISGTPGDSTMRSAPVKIASRVTAERLLHARRQRRQRRAQIARGAAVGDGDARAARRAQLRRGDARAPEPDHEHALVLQIDRHRTLSVSNSPRIAQANDTIQKRTTIRDSGQPFFSK